MDYARVSVSGKVVAEDVNSDSKSAHRAVVLKTDDGESYILRRRDGPAFSDGKLAKLVGKKIEAEGMAGNGALIMESWKVVR